ncbi:MAG: Uma2 family endonuclease, partial [Bryobacterales bacterium]|nr:Uma2 family endonuclease [Bryobacterales bacterium]
PVRAPKPGYFHLAWRSRANEFLDTAPCPSAGQPEVEYPYSDGKVLIEIDPHARSIIEMRNSLKMHFIDRADAYMAGSMAVYYRQGDPTAVVEPDVFVVLGAQHKEWRKSYLIWEEGGVVPSFVVDVAADLPGRRDATSKRAKYERIGVREYWRFDPLGELIPDGLEGWRLEGGRYKSVQAVREAGWHRSEALGLELRPEGWLLRFHDPLLGRDLLTHAETSAALERAERERDRANQRIRELEARLRSSSDTG